MKFRWYPLVVALFATSLVISNIIAVKLFQLGSLILPAGVILFPLAYILGDVLTEVYGYAKAREAIWIGFGCNLMAVIAIWIAGLLPPALNWNASILTGPEQAQLAYDAILGFTPRLLLASFAAYLVGEFTNSYVLAKLKVRTDGRYLWIRTIGSTIFGQGVDSLIFITIAFAGILPSELLLSAILAQWMIKTAIEIIATPLTYLVVNTLKRVEGIDYFDRETNFRPV